MKKQGYALFNPRTLIFIFGGAIFGFLLTEKIEVVVIGGIIGGVISFFIK